FEILFEVSDPFRPENRNNILSAREHPRQRQLCGRTTFCSGQFMNMVDERQIASEVLSLKARRAAAIIAFFKIFKAPNAPGEKTTPQWAVSNETDSEITAGLQDTVFRVSRPE